MQAPRTARPNQQRKKGGKSGKRGRIGGLGLRLTAQRRKWVWPDMTGHANRRIRASGWPAGDGLVAAVGFELLQTGWE
jgi:hypothetical protein